MNINPRLDRLLPEEEWKIVNGLKSQFSILFNWNHVIVCLKENAPTFEQDKVLLKKMGFTLMENSNCRLIRCGEIA